jgi:SNF family Na+-dependent transporter
MLQLWLQAVLVWMAVNALILAIYAGWIMKIGHARKALQLPSEGVYNLWRVGIRWVAPVTLLVALYQWFSLS